MKAVIVLHGTFERTDVIVTSFICLSVCLSVCLFVPFFRQLAMLFVVVSLLLSCRWENKNNYQQRHPPFGGLHKLKIKGSPLKWNRGILHPCYTEEGGIHVKDMYGQIK